MPLSPNPSGEELADAVRSAAARAGQSVWRYAAPIHSNPTSFINTLEVTRCPKPATVARVQALLDGRPVPPQPKRAG